MSFWWCCLLFLYSGGSVTSFPANDIVNEPRTKSHSSITLEAIYKATAIFLQRAQIANNTDQSTIAKIVSTFFGTDGDSQQKYLNTIREINGYMNEVKRDKAFSSHYNVNAERIHEAHLLIKRLRIDVQNMSRDIMIVKNNITIIREKIAAILYILQEFYSNTNWVELYGSTIYEDFGQDTKLKVSVSTSKEHTCISCEYVNGVERCVNNTLGEKLTSGYKSGQDVAKPFSQGQYGKCSHGTQDDTSRNLTAIGGIYKGRSNQNKAPHSYLHKAAAEAAVKATEYYLIDEERGLKQLMGAETFRDVFSIRSRENIVKTSLTFVIDITGSMGDDIEGVKTATKKIVNEAKDSKFVPNNYILVTFSDPASLTTGRVTSDPFTMLTWLSEIIVSGGDDCPEYAMSGMLKGIEMSNNNSKIYLLTDADAKDEHLENEVKSGMKKKNLKSVIFLTGQCARRKRGVSQPGGEGTRSFRRKRSSLSVFERIAMETGGKVYEIEVAEVETIVEKEIRETFPSSNVFVTWLQKPIDVKNSTRASIPVDGYIKTLRINVKPVTSKLELALFYPNGTVVSFKGEHEQRQVDNDILTLLIREPELGEWKLANYGTQAWFVNVTAQSTLDFSINILEESTEGNSFQLSGNPIRGKDYFLVVDIQNFHKNSTCSNVVLLDDNGSDVIDIPVNMILFKEIARYIGHFVPFNKSSAVQIRGTDDQGIPFLRTRTLSIMPVSIQLHIVPLHGDLRLYEASNISFSLTNTGDSSIEFVITISDGTTDVSVQQGSLDGDDVYNGVVTITPNSLQTQVLYFIVTLENYTGNIQTEKRRYSVLDTRAADCTITDYPTMCPLESLNTGNCSLYNWTGSVELSSATIRNSEIKVSSDEVVLDYLNSTDENFTVAISISGHCCTQSFVISIIDKESFFDQCHFVLSKQPLTPVQYLTTTEKEDDSVSDSNIQTQTDDSLVVGMSIGFAVIGILIALLILLLICKMKKRSRHSFQVNVSSRREPNKCEKKTVEENVMLLESCNPNSDGNFVDEIKTVSAK